MFFVGVVGVTEEQRDFDPLRQELAHTAYADLAVRKHDGPGHLLRIRDPTRHDQSGHFSVGLRVLLQNRLHQVARPLAHLRIDAPDVFTQKADAEQRHADQQKRQAEQREQAFRLGTHKNTPYQQHHEQQRR